MASATPLEKWGLYGYPPFFTHPLKPLWNLLAGPGYPDALANFAADHQKPGNILGHVAILFVQVFANFALLGEGDRLLGTGALEKLLRGGSPSAPWFGNVYGSISTASLVVWSGVLTLEPLAQGLRGQKAATEVASRPPLVVSLASVGTIFGAYLCRNVLVSGWKRLADVTALFDWAVAMVFVTLNKKRLGGGGTTDVAPILKKLAPKLVVVFLLRQGVQSLCKRFTNESLQPIVSAFALGFTCIASRNPFGKVTPFHIALLGPSLAVVSNQPWLYFYSWGYFATVLQGLAHEVSVEAPTLPRLANLSEELGHTVHFPNLLLQTAYSKFVLGKSA
jgi:hypothetical protein